VFEITQLYFIMLDKQSAFKWCFLHDALSVSGDALLL